MRGIIPSGVALLDDWLSGVRAGATHLLTGGSGSRQERRRALVSPTPRCAATNRVALLVARVRR